MKRHLVLVAFLATLVGVAVGIHDNEADPEGDLVRSGAAVDADPAFEDPLRENVATREDLGEFLLRSGRRPRLHSAETQGGKTCLVEVDSAGSSSMCLDGGLFQRHRAAFFIRSEGGPATFEELHLSGVAAPEIAEVQLTKTDGTLVHLELNRRRAFVYEATEVDLARDALPASLALYRRGGRLAEVIPIPDHR